MELKSGCFFLIDKEKGWTSFDIVAKVRNTFLKNGCRLKVGHAGTLDPLATGLLILAVGKKTKEINSLFGLDKEYKGQIRLGATTKSFDREFEEENEKPVNSLTTSLIKEKANSFVCNDYYQLPPMYSAIKYQGKRLYKLARKGVVVGKRQRRKVIIHRFSITTVSLPFISFNALVSKGTYIRSLANDLGEKLGVGGYLYSLRRTKIGNFSLDKAEKVNEVVENVKLLCGTHNFSS